MRPGRALALLVAAGALVVSNVGTATAGPSYRESVRLSVDRTTCVATLTMAWGKTTTSQAYFALGEPSSLETRVSVASGVPYNGRASASFQGTPSSDGTTYMTTAKFNKGGYDEVTDVKTVACYGPWTYQGDWAVR